MQQSIMAYVGQRYNFRVVCDPLYPEIDHSVFKEYDWAEFFVDTNKAIPMNSHNLEVRRL